MSNNEHTVVVLFETTPENQQQGLEKIGAYIDGFLSRQPGFIGSELQRGLDGSSLVHIARWRSEADFQAAGVLAREHPDMPALMEFKPSGRGYALWASYPMD